MSSTNINNQEGENCHQKLVWTCDPNTYPHFSYSSPKGKWNSSEFWQ